MVDMMIVDFITTEAALVLGYGLLINPKIQSGRKYQELRKKKMAWQAVRQYGRSFGTGFIVGLPIYITFTDLGFCIARVDGISMQPSLNPTTKQSDIVLLDRWTARDAFKVKRGDVVSLISPTDPDVKLIKRVIGLEGDVVRTINYKKKHVSIPKGHCWVEGDHRGKSYDSNQFGPISLGLINGIATHVIWPPKRWMKIDVSVAKDRVPLKMSFSHCTFSSMLNSQKDSDDIGEKVDSTSNDSSINRDTKDTAVMKKKLLSGDQFIGSGAVTLSGEKLNANPDVDTMEDSEVGGNSESDRNFNIDLAEKQIEVLGTDGKNKTVDNDCKEASEDEKSRGNVSNPKNGTVGISSGKTEPATIVISEDKGNVGHSITDFGASSDRLS